MINLSNRSYQKELMDADDVPFRAMAQTLKELNSINTLLGGHAITISGIKKLLHTNQKNITICEIGCGGGDNLFAIKKYCDKNDIAVKFIGIDMNAECITFARQQYPQMNCQWICSDYAKVDLIDQQPDIIFSSLFCHHFTNEQLVQMMQWLKVNAKSFFINDLQRHWLAYCLIKYLTKFFSRSYLVKNDACLSVARSFRKEDWKLIFNTAGINNYAIDWRWAFRYLVTYNSKEN
jgi:2-polyprenyl-3-methyl-5-hydroxy-6-metoxy-1,4-benzoquinol methylase